MSNDYSINMRPDEVSQYSDSIPFYKFHVSLKKMMWAVYELTFPCCQKTMTVLNRKDYETISHCPVCGKKLSAYDEVKP
jgi:hypothetical protein